MSKLSVSVPDSVIEPDEPVVASDLEVGTIFEMIGEDQLGIIGYDGAVTFPVAEGPIDGDQLIIYSEDELDSSRDLSDIKVRDDLSVRIEVDYA